MYRSIINSSSSCRYRAITANNPTQFNSQQLYRSASAALFTYKHRLLSSITSNNTGNGNSNRNNKNKNTTTTKANTTQQKNSTISTIEVQQPETAQSSRINGLDRWNWTSVLRFDRYDSAQQLLTLTQLQQDRLKRAESTDWDEEYEDHQLESNINQIVFKDPSIVSELDLQHNAELLKLEALATAKVTVHTLLPVLRALSQRLSRLRYLLSKIELKPYSKKLIKQCIDLLLLPAPVPTAIEADKAKKLINECLDYIVHHRTDGRSFNAWDYCILLILANKYGLTAEIHSIQAGLAVESIEYCTPELIRAHCIIVYLLNEREFIPGLAELNQLLLKGPELLSMIGTAQLIGINTQLCNSILYQYKKLNSTEIAELLEKKRQRLLKLVPETEAEELEWKKEIQSIEQSLIVPESVKTRLNQSIQVYQYMKRKQLIINRITMRLLIELAHQAGNRKLVAQLVSQANKLNLELNTDTHIESIQQQQQQRQQQQQQPKTPTQQQPQQTQSIITNINPNISTSTETNIPRL